MKTNPLRRSGLLALALTLALATLSACAAPTASPTATAEPQAAQAQPAATVETTELTGEYQLITAKKAKQIMDSEPGVTVVDVRELSEYNEGHIPGAVLLSLGEISARAAEVLPDQDATLLVYCRSGRRSKMGADTLLSLGYTHVLDFGGIVDWPYEVVR